MKNNQEELWITNINRFQDISISDLRITVRRGASINLFAKKKNGLSLYNITKQQIEKSLTNGSLYKKSNHIKIREIAPTIQQVQMVEKKIEIAPVLDKSSLRVVRKPQEIEKIDFPDLDLEEGSAEEFAAESADMDVADRAPVLAVDPIFKHLHDGE